MRVPAEAVERQEAAAGPKAGPELTVEQVRLVVNLLRQEQIRQDKDMSTPLLHVLTTTNRQQELKQGSVEGGVRSVEDREDSLGSQVEAGGDDVQSGARRRPGSRAPGMRRA